MGRIKSEHAVAQLVEKYMKLVFSICLRITGDYYAAEDLTQETFLSAMKAWDTYDGTNEKAWLCRIASNKSVDYNRARARQAIPLEEPQAEELSAGETPLDLVLAKEAAAHLIDCCNTLDPPYREVARMVYAEHFSADEIAEKTGRKKKTVQTQIYRARNMLREIYRKEGADEGADISDR